MRSAIYFAAAVAIGVVSGTAIAGMTGSLVIGMVAAGAIAGVALVVLEPAPEPLHSLERLPLPTEWTCHVCGELRPDEMIGLIQRECRMGPGKLTVSVRYCRDRDACAGGAEELAEQWLDVARER